MTSGPHRRGRRDNGLEASAYAAAADVDPRVGEHLLDVLGLAGIAAYLQPAADLHPVTRTTMLPNRPTDRLFVDRDHLAEARGFLDQLRSDETAADRATKPPKPTRATPRRGGDPSEPGDPGQSGNTDGGGDAPGAADPTRPAEGFADATRSAGEADPADPSAQATGSAAGTVSGAGTEPGEGTDVEAEWARIVAEFDAPLDAPIPPWPVAEDVPDQPEPADRGGPGDPTGPPDPAGPRDPADRGDGEGDRAGTTDRGDAERPPGWRAGAQRPLIESLDADDPFEPEDEGYEPPPPPPIPRPSRYTALALLAIGAGLLLFFWPGLLTSIGFGEKLTLGLGVLGILVGFGTLVWRLRTGDDDEEEDPDDGAVV
jgi:hypothetical protein